MSYSLLFTVELESIDTGLTLYGQLYDTNGAASGGQIVSGWAEIGHGVYSLLASIPDNFRGSLLVFKSSDNSFQAATSINPEEAEMVKTINTTVGTLETESSALTRYNNLSSQGNTTYVLLSAMDTTLTDVQTTVDDIYALISVAPPGSGEKDIVVTVLDNLNTPVEGAEVWVTALATVGAPRLRQGYTDSLGKVNFNLDIGNYYLWCGRDGVNFTNPTPLTVV